jgi:hypothetical protein
VIHGRDSLNKSSIPVSTQSTTGREEESVINADSVSVIYKVGCNIEGMSSSALVDASNKSLGMSQMSVMASPHGEPMVELGYRRVEE